MRRYQLNPLIVEAEQLVENGDWHIVRPDGTTSTLSDEQFRRNFTEVEGTAQELGWADCKCLTWAMAPEMGPRKKGHHPSCPEGHEESCQCFYCELNQKNQNVLFWE